MNIFSNWDAPRSLSVTKAGWIFIGLTMGVGVAALNSGNNLLFLLLGGMLSLIVGSGLLSEAMLRYVDIERQLPRRLDAEAIVPVRLKITNSAWWPLFSLRFQDEGRRLKPEDPEIQGVFGYGYATIVPTGESKRIVIEYDFETRGYYEFDELTVETRFPFELFEKQRSFSMPDSVFVLPAKSGASDPAPGLEGLGDSELSSEPGWQGVFFGLREYLPGDSTRDIDWKGLARKGELVIKQRTPIRTESVRFLLLNVWPDSEQPETSQRFERALSRLRYLFEEVYFRQNIDIQLPRRRIEIRGERQVELYGALETIATLELEDSNELASDSIRDSYHLAVGPRKYLSSVNAEHYWYLDGEPR